MNRVGALSRWHLTASAAALAAAFFVLIPGQAQAQGGSPACVGEPGIGDAYYPGYGNGGYDARRYNLDVSYNPASDQVKGEATIKMRATKRLCTFNFDLDGLNVQRVEVNGDKSRFSRSGQELTIEPKQNLRNGEKFKVFVKYAGVPTEFQIPGTDIRTGFMSTPEGATVADLAWAPNGAELAVIVALAPAPEPAGGREMSVDWPYWGGDSGPGRRVGIVHVETGRAEFVTGTELDVAELSWSPDGRRLALAASPTSSASRFYDQDIYLVDRGSMEARPVVRLEGVDSGPVWSPDGDWIAFATQHGEGSRDWLQGLGLYNVRTGQITYPDRARIEEDFGSPRHFTWASNTRLLFQSDHHFRAPILALDVPDGRIRQISPLDLAFYSDLTVSGSGETMLFRCETIDRPRELCASRVDRFRPRRLTDLNPGLHLPPSETEILTWRSRDERWNVEGVLVRPRGSRSPRPLVTLIEGGPAMARIHFGLVQWYPVHALLAGGYAVFVPNTRGRSGYSRAFRRAIPDNRDFAPGPFADMMTGIDKLIRDGVADPARLGIAGHSYGGFLSAYSITQTTRFGAASISDAPFNFPYAMSLGAANPAMQEHWRHQSGFSDPYDPADLGLMRAQSPITRIADARTPSLIEFGYREFGGVGEMSGGEFFQGLRRFRVPAEFILYPRTGHGIHEPRLRRESAQRNLEWFDYWLLGRATDRMRERYTSNPG